tara:strand:+ start:442 stop:642 length:201 start_codon:yes stop_codon:yes gene_type:complete
MDHIIVKDSEKKTIEALKFELDMLIKKDKVDEATLQSLNNLISTLVAIKENYYWRLLRNFKRDVTE